MDPAAIKFGFIDELNKLAAGETAPPYNPGADRGDGTPEGSGPSFMDNLKEHFREHGAKYLGLGGAAALGYGLVKGTQRVWPGVKRYGAKTIKGVGRWGLRMAPFGVAAYALGRGLKAGERELNTEQQRDAERVAKAQGRYEPFETKY